MTDILNALSEVQRSLPENQVKSVLDNSALAKVQQVLNNTSLAELQRANEALLPQLYYKEPPWLPQLYYTGN